MVKSGLGWSTAPGRGCSPGMRATWLGCPGPLTTWVLGIQLLAEAQASMSLERKEEAAGKGLVSVPRVL